MERDEDFITGRTLKAFTNKTSSGEYARRIDELAKKYRPKQVRQYVENGCVVRVFESVK